MAWFGLDKLFNRFKKAAAPEENIEELEISADEDNPGIVILDRNNVPMEDPTSTALVDDFLVQAVERGKAICDQARAEKGSVETDGNYIPDLKEISDDEITMIIERDCEFVIMKNYNNGYERNIGKDFTEDVQKQMGRQVFGKMTQWTKEGRNLLLFAICEKGSAKISEMTGEEGDEILFGIYPIDRQEVLEARRNQIMSEGLKEMGFADKYSENDM